MLAVFTKAGKSPTFYNIWKCRRGIIRAFNKICCRFLKKSKNCQHRLAEPYPDIRTVHASSIPPFNYNHSSLIKRLGLRRPRKALFPQIIKRELSGRKNAISLATFLFGRLRLLSVVQNTATGRYSPEEAIKNTSAGRPEFAAGAKQKNGAAPVQGTKQKTGAAPAQGHFQWPWALAVPVWLIYVCHVDGRVFFQRQVYDLLCVGKGEYQSPRHDVL